MGIVFSRDIMPLIAPAMKAAGENQRFVRQIQMEQALKQAGLSPSAEALGGMNAQQALVMQNMQTMMMQTMQVVSQMAAILATLQAKGLSFQDYGISDDQMDWMNENLPTSDGDRTSESDFSEETSDESTDTRGEIESPRDEVRRSGSAGIRKALNTIDKNIVRDLDEEDEDLDSDVPTFEIHEDAVTRFQELMDEDTFSKADLGRAFATVLANPRTPSAKKEKVLELFFKLHAQEMVSLKPVLKTTVVQGLKPDLRRTLAEKLGEMGLLKADGSDNKFLTKFLDEGLESDSRRIQKTARLALKRMVKTFFAAGASVPQKDRLVTFLKEHGFTFTPEGTLKPDAEQPFPIQA